MFIRRSLTSLSLLLAAAACADSLAPSRAPRTEPHFVTWAPTARPAFSAEGLASDGTLEIGEALAFGMPTPPAVDRSSSAVGDVQTLTWAHDGGNGANRLLIVSVSLLNASRPVSSVTFKGVPLTFRGARNNDDNKARVELWYLVAPPTGSGNIVVTRTGGDETIAGALSLTGVNQTDPLGAFASAASTGSGSTNPSLALAGAAGQLVVDAVVTNGETVLTAGPNQTQRHSRDYDNEMDGAGSTEPGAASVTMSWSKTAAAEWALAAVAVNPAPSLALTQYQASFWAVRGQSRSIGINYSSGGVTSPFLRFTATEPTFVPGRGTLAAGDSVLITVTVDPWVLAVRLEPSGLQFGQPAQLKLWYGGAGGDLNGDGMVNGSDGDIEANLLGMWYQQSTDSPWSAIPATKSLAEKSLASALQHFSGYAVSW